MMKMASTSSALKPHLHPHEEVNAALLHCRSKQERMSTLVEAKTVSDEDASAESAVMESRNADNSNDCDILIGVDIGDKGFGDDDASAIKFIDDEDVTTDKKISNDDRIPSTVLSSNFSSTPVRVVSSSEQSSDSLENQNGLDDRKRGIKEVIDSVDNSAKRAKTSEISTTNKNDEICNGNADINTKRNRLDSIDIDSHAFDFEDMGLDLGQSYAVEVLMKLPALENGSKANNSRKPITPPEPRKENVFDETATTTNSTNARGRGYSLDFFSFGMNEKESVEPELTRSCEVNQSVFVHNPIQIPDEVGSSQIPDQVGSSINNDQAIIKAFDDSRRPRGDSIIFDPTSFSDGGIHEENALQRSKKSHNTSEIDEIEIMNSPGFIEPPSGYDMGKSANPTIVVPDETVSMSMPNTSSDKNQCPLTDPATGIIKMGTLVQTNGAIEFEPDVNVSNVTSDNAPSKKSAPSSAGGSNCTLQMELLNQGGRIGMYLPNDRKARIAKFHSKRHLRIWRKRIKYDCRKKLADSRPRIKGRFVKRSDMD